MAICVDLERFKEATKLTCNDVVEELVFFSYFVFLLT